MKHDCPECSRRAAEFCQIEEQRNALAARVDALESALASAVGILDSLSTHDDFRYVFPITTLEIIDRMDAWKHDGLLKEQP